MRIAVTGATGLVGRALCEALAERGHAVRALVRSEPDPPVTGAAETRDLGELGGGGDCAGAFDGVEAAVHCAARVHVMRETEPDPDAAFRRINAAGTEAVARACAAAGVKRLVFVSSIKVNGEATRPGRPFTELDAPAPADAYARSKHEAEGRLADVAAETGIETVVVRAPLVYGPGAGGNFARLWLWVGREYPLPLGRIDNRRSLIGVDNLADALALCAEHPRAAGRTYLVADSGAVSTPDLVRAIARAQGVKPRLWPVPAGLLRTLAALAGKRAAADRLTGNLEVSTDAIRGDLEWTPEHAMADALARIAAVERGAP